MLMVISINNGGIKGIVYLTCLLLNGESQLNYQNEILSSMICNVFITYCGALDVYASVVICFITGWEHTQVDHQKLWAVPH